MKQYGLTESTVKPDAITVDDYSVWVASDIKEATQKQEDDTEQTIYQYQLTQYEKNEYIQNIGTQVLDTQDALTDLYSMMSEGSSNG